MREILFRGKQHSYHSEEWNEGSLIFYPDVNRAFISSGEYKGFGGFHEVKKDTVGQFIGLFDKNGKKIFEGDIVDILTENEEIGVIAYDEGGFVVKADGFCVDFHNNINGTDLEVIGNIHDNPELLKEGNSNA